MQMMGVKVGLSHQGKNID